MGRVSSSQSRKPLDSMIIHISYLVKSPIARNGLLFNDVANDTKYPDMRRALSGTVAAAASGFAESLDGSGQTLV